MKTNSYRISGIKHEYQATKFNKCDIQYQVTSALPAGSYLTTRVKIEKFQGFSNASNLWEYFRLRGETSWKSGEQVTGLWRTDYPHVHYGDRKTNNGKSLILFYRSPDYERLTVYTFPDGYYPSRLKIVELINALK